MSEYYLISQLPSLDGISENLPLPITEERFLELCNQFLSEKAKKELAKLSLIPEKTHEKSGSKLIEDWNNGERTLRLVLSKVRANKLNKPSDTENKSFPLKLVQTAQTAVEMENPMEAELFLNRHRLDFLESLRPLDNFCEDSVFYYWLRLKLISRIKQFDSTSGETAYKNIYNSILNGDKLEAVQ